MAGKSTSSRPSAASTSTAARPLRSKLGLRATNAARFHGGRARDVREGVAPTTVTHERVVVERAQPLQGRVGAAQHGTQVVVLPEERVEAAAHLAALAVGQRDRPRPHPAAEPVLALEHGDPHAALGQAQRRGQPRDATAHDDDVARGCRHARGIRRGQLARAAGGTRPVGRARGSSARCGRSRRGRAGDGVHEAVLPPAVGPVPARRPDRSTAAARRCGRPSRSRARSCRGSGAAARRTASRTASGMMMPWHTAAHSTLARVFPATE